LCQVSAELFADYALVANSPCDQVHDVIDFFVLALMLIRVLWRIPVLVRGRRRPSFFGRLRLSECSLRKP
jgi:hypothetical protein